MDDNQACVLVVDDIEPIVEELVTLLELQGLPAIGAQTLDAAITVLERAPAIRVIACDVRLDREFGLDIVSRIATRSALDGRSFGYIFVTGDPMCAESQIAGAQHAILTKPVKPRALVGLVRELLAEQDLIVGPGVKERERLEG